MMPQPPPSFSSRRMGHGFPMSNTRSEEHTSELQSRLHLVCRLLLEKKKHSCSSVLTNQLHHRSAGWAHRKLASEVFVVYRLGDEPQDIINVVQIYLRAQNLSACPV